MPVQNLHLQHESPFAHTLPRSARLSRATATVPPPVAVCFLSALRAAASGQNPPAPEGLRTSTPATSLDPLH